ERVSGDKVRGKPERFAEHYSQATLFWNSQTPVEKAHIVRAFRFELTKVAVPAVRERVVSMLANVASELAQAVAQGLGMALPQPMPRALLITPQPEVLQSPPLSLLYRPGDGSIRGRRVAILVVDGVDGEGVRALHAGLLGQGAVPRLVGARLGAAASESGDAVQVEVTLETTPSVLYDAVVVPDGKRAAMLLGKLGHALEFIKDQYRHCKPILALGAGADLLDDAGVPARLPSGGEDSGLILVNTGDTERALALFVAAIAGHRHYARETDPPPV
ncbi:MAG TPA: catalase-related domain-containing protein, partial [Pseudomonadota bacterium]|nr:catalase-related domain-containing protein [Pseudomonadota bacterium]